MPANGDGSRLKEGNNFRRIYRLLFWVIFNSQLIKYAKQSNVPRFNFLSKRYKPQSVSQGNFDVA